MALQGSGQITLQQIASEYGGSAASHPIHMSEYYKGTTGPVSSVVGNGNVPTSGQVGMSNYYSGTKGPSSGGSKSSAQNNVSAAPTYTSTHSITPLNPYGYGGDIDWSISGTLRADPYTPYDSYSEINGGQQNKTLGLAVKLEFMYNGSVKATYGYTTIHSSTFSFRGSYGHTKSVSASGTVSCSHPVNQIRISHYANPGLIVSTHNNNGWHYCWHDENITVATSVS